MKKMVLVSKWVVGMTPIAMGVDKSLNPFKKSKSQLFINKLKEECKDSHLDCEIMLDNQSTSIAKIINDDADLVLISPFIRSAVLISLTEYEKQKCYFLTEKEYVDLEVTDLVNTISIL